MVIAADVPVHGVNLGVADDCLVTSQGHLGELLLLMVGGYGGFPYVLAPLFNKPDAVMILGCEVFDA